MRKLLFIAATILLVTTASAQQEIVFDNVTNSIGDTALVAGNTHILSIRYRNFPAAPCSNGSCVVNSGFILFSPDGATWNLSVGNFTQEFNDAADPFWTSLFVNHYENPNVGGDGAEGPNDGVSPDYIGFAAVGPLSPPFLGLPAGFDEIALQIEIESNLSDTGLRICIDSSSIGRLNTWSWACFGRIECSQVVPDWAGPYCFTIVALGCSGDVDIDGQVTDDDLTFLLQYYFGFGESPFPDRGDVNNDGTIDISDIIYLANFLHNGGPAPCAVTGPGGFDWKDKPDTRQAGND